MEPISQSIKRAVLELIKKSATSVPKDVENAIKSLRSANAANPITKSQLEWMIENLEYGKQNHIPLCQDTGLVNFFIDVGENFPKVGDYRALFLESLHLLTQDCILRPNTVDPFSKKNQDFNGGEEEPPIYLDLRPNRSDLVITVLNKGGGAENISSLFMLSPGNALNEMVPKIVETIKQAGGKPCPPVILGIGIGGDASKTMYLAKKALLRPLGSRNKRSEVATLENEILNKINQLNIGIMGLGGNSNCLDVRIEWAMRHPASFPVGLVVQCYSHRTFSCRITADGKTEFGRLTADFEFEQGDW